MAWPKTSDKEFSKRVCRTFMFGYFIQTLITLVIIVLDAPKGEIAINFFSVCQPAYMLVFGAVIAKSGVENVFKGKANSTSDSGNG